MREQTERPGLYCDLMVANVMTALLVSSGY